MVLQLAGRLAGAADPMLGQLAAGGWIDRVAQLLPAGGGGLDEKFFLQPRLLHHVFHDKLRHRAAADVAVADKKHFGHASRSP